MPEVVDDLGRLFRLAGPPRRIVSLVPSLTETLFALGCGDRLVGVTRYCVEPAGAVERVERVGGSKNPDVARIVSLRPDLVIVNAEENRREDFSAFEAAGLQVFVTFSRRVGDLPSLFERLGQLTGSQAAAEHLIAGVQQLLSGGEGQGGETPPRVFCPIWKNPWMSFNADTYAHDVLRLAGGANICADHPERYPVVCLDAVATAAPQVILLPDEPYVFQPKDLPALAPLAETPAMRCGRVHFIDGKALSWYGPRAITAVRTVRAALEV